MVAPGGSTESNKISAIRGKWARRGKPGALRNLVGGILHPEVHRLAKAEAEDLVTQQWKNHANVEISIDEGDILHQEKEAVLKQAEGFPSKSEAAEPVVSPISLEAPVISSIVDSAVKASNSTRGCSSGSGQSNSATLKIRNDRQNWAEDRNDSQDRSEDAGNSITSSTNVESSRSAIRDDTVVDLFQDGSEKTITKLLLGDVWSGNDQIVECSLKLINICLERDPTAARAMVPVGGHTVMLGIMKKWRSHAKIQAHACHFFGKCCETPNNEAFADAALKYGAFHNINKALIKFPKYLMVQTAAFQAIEQMLLVCTDHETVVNGINVALIVAAMQKFAVAAPIQKSGAGILQQLAATADPVLARTITTTGGLEVLGAAYHHFCNANDVDHCAIRERCRATIPYLLADPASQTLRRSISESSVTPKNTGCGSSLFACLLLD